MLPAQRNHFRTAKFLVVCWTLLLLGQHGSWAQFAAVGNLMKNLRNMFSNRLTAPTASRLNTDIGPGIEHSLSGLGEHLGTRIRQRVRSLQDFRNQSLLQLSSPTRLNLLQNRVSEDTLSAGLQSVRSLDDLVSRLSNGQLRGMDIEEEIQPLAISSQFSSFSSPTGNNVCESAAAISCATDSPYRTITGQCNHLTRTSWGSANTNLIRILPNTYSDGAYSPRSTGADGQPLPTARYVSSTCTSRAESAASDHFSLSVMQWGQFIDHDITHVPIQRPDSKSGLECCTEGNRKLPACQLAIPVPANDPLYRNSGIRCLNFVRSIPFTHPNCPNQAAQQTNQITHFIDGSNVYGSTIEELNELRESRSPQMHTSGDNQLPLLSEDDEGCEEARSGSNENCFHAGDSRVNEQPSLTVIHTVWLNMHNYIATRLKNANAAASNEQVFQETRAIVVALMQKIIYSEWLPIIVGQSLTAQLGLNQTSSYNVNIHPGVINEVSTAAFRFGHSLISGKINVYGSRRNHVLDELNLSESFFEPGRVLQKRGVSVGLARGLCQQPIQRMDSAFTAEIAGKLFRGSSNLGLDLIALNIQRGRDHGIGTYMQTRNLLAPVCSDVTTVNSWTDLRGYISNTKIKLLQSVYSSVEDVDLFVGGVMENPRNALVGPTFGCLLAEQFLRLKLGDRFFYNHQSSIFSRDQLEAIDRVAWSSILCATNDMTSVPRDAFRLPRKNNPYEACKSVPRLDISAWNNFHQSR